MSDSKRDLVLRELVSTERSYNKDLQAVVDVFIHPLQTSRKLTASEVATIFNNWETLYQLSTTLLTDLEKVHCWERRATTTTIKPSITASIAATTIAHPLLHTPSPPCYPLSFPLSRFTHPRGLAHRPTVMWGPL